MRSILLLIMLVVWDGGGRSCAMVDAWVMNGGRNVYYHQYRRSKVYHALSVVDEVPEEDDEVLGDDMDTGTVDLGDLNWRVQKLRLEEQHTKRFLKAKPRFLPFDECKKWVQAWGKRWESQKDWEDWIAMGEKRNPYIPSQPDEYYGGLGEWTGWDDFLGIDYSGRNRDDEQNQ